MGELIKILAHDQSDRLWRPDSFDKWKTYINIVSRTAISVGGGGGAVVSGVAVCRPVCLRVCACACVSPFNGFSFKIHNAVI